MESNPSGSDKHGKGDSKHTLGHDIHDLMRSGLFADVEVICGDKTWQLHKNILSTRSVWFEKALTGPFVEATGGCIHIQEFDSEKVGWVLGYIYSGTLAHINALEYGQAPYETSIHLFNLADFFLLPCLTKECLALLRKALNKKADELLRSRGWGYNSPVVEFMDDLFNAINMVYSEELPSDNPLKATFIRFFAKARFYLMVDEAFIGSLGQVPDFAVDVLKNLSEAGDWVGNNGESVVFRHPEAD